MPSEFSMVDSLRFGWKSLWPNLVLLVQIILTFAALIGATAVAAGLLAAMHAGIILPLVIAALVCALIVVGVGFTRVALLIADEKPAAYRDLWLPVSVIVRYVAANLLAAVVIIAGLIFFIIPGVYLIVRLCMVRFAALEESGNAFGVLSRSSQLTEGVRWQLFGFLLLVIVINMLGAALFNIGSIVTVPWTMIAMAHVYRKLTLRGAAAPQQ